MYFHLCALMHKKSVTSSRVCKLRVATRARRTAFRRTSEDRDRTADAQMDESESENNLDLFRFKCFSILTCFVFLLNHV
jgi:hypothetical protein